MPNDQKAEQMDALLAVASVIERLDVPFFVAGSFASNAYGFYRATADVDLVADLKISHVEPLVQALTGRFYVSADAVRQAVMSRGSFNVIEFSTSMKLDVFTLKREMFQLEQMQRRVRRSLDPEGTIATWLASPEDTILAKLDWYRLGGGVSDRQWGDVLGVMKVQAENLDLIYLRRWAAELCLTDLLERALADSGLA
jgi:hypothetical protein